MPFSAPWRPEILAAIENSDKFIFVLSPDSLDSQPCANELQHAIDVNKQVIPIVWQPAREGQLVPSSVGDLNWIFFTDDAHFDSAFAQLTAALDMDLGWTKAHTRLLTRSSEWISKQQDRSLLLRGSDLRAAEQWLAAASSHAKTPPTPAQREYITASRHAADRSARQWRGALAGGLVIALVLATVALIQRNKASNEATVATAREYAAEATADLSSKPAQSLQEALQSTNLSPSSTGIQALRLALAADHTRMAIQPGFGAGTQATWSPAAEIIAVTGHRNTVQLWNPRTGRLLQVLGSLPAADPISQLSYNRQGDLLAAVSANGLVALWNPLTGRAVNMNLLNADIKLRKTGNPFLSGTWDPRSGKLYLTGSGLPDILVYDPATGSVEGIRSPGPILDLAFAPSGSRAFALISESSLEEQALIVNFTNLTSVTLQKPADLESWGVSQQACWTPDGSQIVTWDPEEAQDETLRIFSAGTEKQLFERPGATFSAAACGKTFALGPYVAAGDYAGEGTLLQTRNFGPYAGTHAEFTALGLNGHTQLINSVATSPDSNYIATASDDGTVRIWDAVTGHQLSLINDGQAVESVQFSMDGGAILSVTADGTVLVADAGVGEPAVVLQAPGPGKAYALGFAASGRLVYGVSETTTTNQDDVTRVTSLTALLWRAATGAVVESYRLPAPPQVGVATCTSALQFDTFCELGSPAQEFSGFTVSPDGNYLAYATATGVVARSFRGGEVKRLGLKASATGLAFTGPGDDLVVKTNRAVDVWLPFGHERLAQIPQPSAPLDAELSPDGSRLATANAGGVTVLWNVHTGRPVARFSPRRVIIPYVVSSPVPIRVAVNKDGTEVAVGTDLGSIDLWRVAGHRLLTSQVMRNSITSNTYPVTELAFAGNGSVVMGVNYPQIAAGDSEPPGSGLILDASTGRVVTTLDSPAQNGPPINPGVALSPDGDFVLGGVEGFAPPATESGSDAVYGLAGSEEFTDLQNTVTAAPIFGGIFPNLVPVSPWAPDGIHLLTGAAGIYACDSCGSLPQMQSIAQSRLNWAVPLTPAHDDPPSDTAFS